MHTLRKIGAGLALALLTLGTLLALAGSAAADPGDAYVSGYSGAGRVMSRSTHPGEDCTTRRAIYVMHLDDAETANDAERGDSAPGMGLVCVTKAGYAAFPVGTWWPGQVRGPRG